MATKKQFNSFEEMLSASDVPVLVDFYADRPSVRQKSKVKSQKYKKGTSP